MSITQHGDFKAKGSLLVTLLEELFHNFLCPYFGYVIRSRGVTNIGCVNEGLQNIRLILRIHLLLVIGNVLQTLEFTLEGGML